jgi:hypothetical protein
MVMDMLRCRIILPQILLVMLFLCALHACYTGPIMVQLVRGLLLESVVRVQTPKV